jgi:GT2 family glycosyltransferase
VHTDIVRAALGDRASVTALPDGSRTLEYPLDNHPLVSIVIPTRGSSARIRGTDRVLVVEAVRGVLELSTYRNLEVVVVADDPTPQSVVDELLALGGGRVRLVRWPAAFDFSAKINRGAVSARGEYLVVLNDDVELITPDWIEVMLGLLQQEGVGLVGTMLQFEDGTVQHGGHLYRDSGAGHIAFRWPLDRDDALGSLGVDREVSGVTAACAMVSASTFRAVGGFSTLFPGNYNDVDFCLKVRTLGNSVVWTPRARLYHFESKTRVATIAPVELERLRERWSEKLLVDPYWP